jgi:hypothetical protein
MVVAKAPEGHLYWAEVKQRFSIKKNGILPIRQKDLLQFV